MDQALANWLVTGGLGPALVAVPVTWSAGRLGEVAHRWLDRIRREDGLSRLILAADPPIRLTRNELAAVRRLLEDPKTWQAIGIGLVEDLVAKICACLHDDDRASSDRVIAGRAIARGLMEFAVFDLEPELFQRVLMARIARLETRQASKVDEVILQLHAGLVVWAAYQDQVDELRFRRVLTQLGLILGRLPPGPAGRDEVLVYLARLIGWLNADPWPRDPRLRGPMLTPADIEQKLAIAAGTQAGGRNFDADELTDRCTRLVVLGDSGSGKTWLARRAARRCAEAALETLTNGTGLDEVELPLFTTCSLLAESKEDIRAAAVSSALVQLGDLGGSRIVDALQELFTERNGPTLLMIDGLDEARNPDYRLRLADSLPWRIVLTSRPSSWRQQLPIDTADPAHLVGSLLPLAYPESVESFIARWFTADPARGRALAAQIRSRMDLQQGATVPLILTFYCIIGGEEPLPETRHTVHELVLWRLLSGVWRQGGDVGNPAKRASYLRAWAWEWATKDEGTGVGTWADEILTSYVEMSEADRAAVDHVAVPVQLPDFATGATLRRFVHRSIREYLTAEHVATQMSAAKAAAELLNHLWYDPDWEYAAPAALAMHPDRDQVLAGLIRHVTQSKHVPDNLAGFDGCWELRRFLAQVAEESHETDWTTASAALIGRALLDHVAARRPLKQVMVLTGSVATGRFVLPATPGWPTTNAQIRRVILAQMEAADAWETPRLTAVLNNFYPEPGDLARARARVLQLLDTAAYRRNHTEGLTEALNSLAPEPDDLARARARLLDLLDTAKAGIARWIAHVVLDSLAPEPTDLARIRARMLHLLPTVLDTAEVRDAPGLAGMLTTLAPEPDDLTLARTQVLKLLDTAEATDARLIAEALSSLRPEPEDLARARARVLNLLEATTKPLDVQVLAEALGILRPELGDHTRARARVFDLLGSPADTWDAEPLAKALSNLHPEPGDLSRARARVLNLLDAAEDLYARALTRALSSLHPEPGDLSRARARILTLLETAGIYGSGALQLADLLKGLHPGPGDLARARGRILNLLGAARPMDAPSLAETLNSLCPEPGDLARTRARILDLLDTGEDLDAIFLTEALNKLPLHPGDLARARSRVLNLLDSAERWNAAQLAQMLTNLYPEPGDLARARSCVLGVLDATDLVTERLTEIADWADIAVPELVRRLAEALNRLGPEPEDLTRARRRVLDLLDNVAKPRGTRDLAQAALVLSSDPGDLTRARRKVLEMMDGAEPREVNELATVLKELGPGADELVGLRSWSTTPGHGLLAATRRNTPLPTWLKALPTLSGP
ncbi:MAG: NACHT domain-containing protein [Streptosporangiaceae bacterium]